MSGSRQQYTMSLLMQLQAEVDDSPPAKAGGPGSKAASGVEAFRAAPRQTVKSAKQTIDGARKRQKVEVAAAMASPEEQRRTTPTGSNPRSSGDPVGSAVTSTPIAAARLPQQSPTASTTGSSFSPLEVSPSLLRQMDVIAARSQSWSSQEAAEEQRRQCSKPARPSARASPVDPVVVRLDFPAREDEADATAASDGNGAKGNGNSGGDEPPAVPIGSQGSEFSDFSDPGIDLGNVESLLHHSADQAAPGRADPSAPLVVDCSRLGRDYESDQRFTRYVTAAVYAGHGLYQEAAHSSVQQTARFHWFTAAAAAEAFDVSVGQWELLVVACRRRRLCSQCAVDVREGSGGSDGGGGPSGPARVKDLSEHLVTDLIRLCGSWGSTPLAPNDVFHLVYSPPPRRQSFRLSPCDACSRRPSTPLVVNDDTFAIIVEPDTLLPPTRISDSVPCLR